MDITVTKILKLCEDMRQQIHGAEDELVKVLAGMNKIKEERE